MSVFEGKNNSISDILGEASRFLSSQISAAMKIEAFIERRIEENNDPSFYQKADLLKRREVLGIATPLIEEVQQSVTKAETVYGKKFSQSNVFSKNP